MHVVYMHVCMCRSIHVCMWRPKVDTRHIPPCSLFYVSKLGLLLNPEFADWASTQATRLLSVEITVRMLYLSGFKCFKCGFWELEYQSSYSYGKFFIHWAISSGLSFLFFFKQHFNAFDCYLINCEMRGLKKLFCLTHPLITYFERHKMKGLQ